MKAIWKQLALVFGLALLTAMPLQVNAAVKNVRCLKTNTGNYYPLVRVSMMVVADGGDTFEIVLKDGEGEANVKSISFETHDEDIDFTKYNNMANPSYVDLTKKIYLITSTGKYFSFKSLPVLTAKEGTNLFDVKVGSEVENDVAAVYFYRGDNPEEAAGIEETVADAPLQLLTPIESQITISGCGEASEAIVYAMDGRQVAGAPVRSGVTTINVEHLSSGVYIVRIGQKALKFLKK